MEEGSVTRVINDFHAVNECELRLKKGDIVQVLRNIDKYWCYVSFNDVKGNVPSNNLIPVEIPHLERDHKLFAALADFPGQQNGDLCFNKGELIIGVQQIDDNWWNGKICNRQGMFPITYTWLLDTTLLKRKETVLLNKLGRVKMNMTAQLDEEMDLNVGDIVHIIEIVDKDWYRGYCGKRSGIFPSTYVTLIENSEYQDKYQEPKNVTLNSNTTVGQFTNDCVISDHNYNSDFGCMMKDEQNFAGDNLFNKNFKELDDLSILNDDYFKMNMPSMFSDEKQLKRNNDSLQPTDLGIIPYGITLYPFYAQYDNELNFHEGEIVSLIRHVDKDWIEGKIDNRKGIFPCNYINIIVDCKPEQNTSVDIYNIQNNCDSYENFEVLVPNSFAIVLYTFDAQMDSDLTVKEGEVVCVEKQMNKDWCEVKNYLGNIGLVPRNYITTYSAPNKKLNHVNHRYSLGNESSHDSFSAVQSEICDWNKRRTYEPHDFYHSWKKDSIDNLISKNLEVLQHSMPSISRSSSPRDPIFTSEGERESEPVINPEPESSRRYDSITDSEFNSDIIESQVPHMTEYQPCSQKFITEDINEKYVPAKYHRSAPLVPEKPKFTCQKSDRIPHRPAPPIPLPGQKPVRRTIEQRHVIKHPNQRIEDLISIKEEQLKVLNQIKDEVQVKYESSLINCDDDLAQDMKYKMRECDDRIRFVEADLDRLKGAEVSEVQRQPPYDTGQESETDTKQNEEISEENRRKKNAEQRQNVISELVYTEKEYVRDLKITYETFNLHNPEFLESRGIDVKVLFGNILEVMHLAEDFLDSLQFAMKGKEEDEQCVGPCFLAVSENMKSVYSQYCMNHDEALSLLEKYESNHDIQKVFSKGLETLRYQIACFDMGSILIKPVQRILKYPLILNELIKATEDNHKDKSELLTAVRTIMDVATYINEYKRRKDIVSKYLEDGNASISSKMARLSLHSVAKKSSRLGVLFTSSLGFGNIVKDPIFQENETVFHALDKTIKNFIKNVDTFMSHMHDVVLSQSNLAESTSYFYQEKNSEVDEFCKVEKTICRQFWKDFENTTQKWVLSPLNTLLELFEGPFILIQKCNDKFLDYVACSTKAEKNKDIRVVQEELLAAKSNFEALNAHLLEELPTLIKLSVELLVQCVSTFVASRKLLSGKITKQYFTLLEHPLMKTAQGDAVESFVVKHNLVVNQISRLSCLMKQVKLEPSVRKTSKTSPLPNRRLSEDSTDNNAVEQSNSQRAYLRSRYRPDILYNTVSNYTKSQPLELTVCPGTLVGVIKKQNPMGDSSVWFVDDGVNKGFLPCSVLEPSNTSSVPIPLSQCQSQSSTRLSREKKNLCTNSSTDLLPPSYDEVMASSSGIPSSNSLSGISVMDQYSSVGNDDNHNYNENIYCEIEEKDHRYAEISEITDPSVPKFYYAIYDFGGQGPHTLSVKSGQVIKVLQFQDLRGNSEWWLVQDRFGGEGYVPANFLGKYNS